MDVVLWPENVVSTLGPLQGSPGYFRPLQQLARDLDMPAATIHTWLRSIRRQAKRALPLAA